MAMRNHLSTFLISLVVVLSFPAVNGTAQSIRKDYNEMTQSEKDAFVGALYALRNGPDLIEDLAIFHNDNFNQIHFNLPDAPEDDVFLAWHRMQIFELEQAMQDINTNLSIPLWDWTTDNSVNSPLWDQDFLGQFDSDWNLARQLGVSGVLPTSTDVANAQAVNNWLDYSDNLEGGGFDKSIVHTGGHAWTGGVMASRSSPLDPVFYLHHGMVDKLWQDWEDAHGTSSYIMTSLPRYPAVNPNDITDSKALGVFFVENGLAELENYTVSNTYRNQEVFYYQYTIKAKNDFIIPSGTNCRIESVNEIRLQPGFHAQSGATFTAKIDADNNVGTVQIVRNTKPFPDIDTYILQDHNPRLQIRIQNNSRYGLSNIFLFARPFDALRTGETSGYKRLQFDPQKDNPILSFTIGGDKFIRYVNPPVSGNYTYVIDSVNVVERTVFITRTREE